MTARTKGNLPPGVEICLLIVMLTAVMLLLWPASLLAGTRVPVILSDNLPAYEEAVEGIRDKLSSDESHAEIKLFNLADLSQISLARKLKALSPEVIISVGTRATISIMEMNLEIPLVFSMVLDPPERLLENRMATGVLLDIPPETQLEWIRKVTPRSKRIGIIHTGNTGRWLNRAAFVAPKLGLKTVSLKLQEISQLPDMLDRLEREADVLLAIPDGTIYNSIITPQIILFCLQHRIPFIGLSSNFTRAGALFALECDYRSIGQEAGEMTNLILRGRRPSNMPHRYPSKLTPCFNMRTARILGIDIDPKLLEKATIFAD